MIPCDDCKGKGYKMSFGNETTCLTCKGDGELAVCESFAMSPGTTLVFRNQRCHNCGVRQNNHNVSEVKA